MRDAIAATARNARAGEMARRPKAPALHMPKIPEGAMGLCLPAALFSIGIVICLCTGGSVTSAMKGFSYSTLALIVAMEIFTGLIAETGFMECVAVKLAIASKGRQKMLLAALSAFMFLVSSTMNNITAVLCILPCIFVLFRAIAPDRRYLCTFFSVLLATSNLGGAASAVGDLPAILIMNTGTVSFMDYTVRAFPFFGATALVLVAFWLALLSRRGGSEDADSTALAVNVLNAQYRYVGVDRKALVPLLMVLTVMLTCWTAVPQSVVGPETIAVVGCLIAIALFRLAGGKPSQIVNMGSILTISSFLFLAAAIGSTGVLNDIASMLRSVAPDPKAYLMLVLLLASVISGLVGAGPAAAVCLPIITDLATTVFAASCPAVMVAYGAAICAGSSLFMWSATAGFILSGKIAEAKLPGCGGGEFAWGISDYLPFGAANYTIQMVIAMTMTAIAL